MERLAEQHNGEQMSMLGVQGLWAASLLMKVPGEEGAIYSHHTESKPSIKVVEDERNSF